MTYEKLQRVETELKRLTDAIRQLKADNTDAKRLGYYTTGKHTAMVKRASMDVTRVLTDLRRAE